MKTFRQISIDSRIPEPTLRKRAKNLGVKPVKVPPGEQLSAEDERKIVACPRRGRPKGGAK